jgi:hypothetical protein
MKIIRKGTQGVVQMPRCGVPAFALALEVAMKSKMTLIEIMIGRLKILRYLTFRLRTHCRCLLLIAALASAIISYELCRV